LLWEPQIQYTKNLYGLVSLITVISIKTFTDVKNKFKPSHYF
jgi:hypothetical protein